MLGTIKQHYVIGLLLCVLALTPATAMAQTASCIPSCDETDSRLLELQIRSPGGGFPLSFFDGETSAGDGYWDLNSAGSDPQLTFNLYADPTGEGTGTFLVASYDGEAMVDNGWSDFFVADHPEARSTSGEFVYLLEAHLGGILFEGVRTVFKVKSEADVLIEVFQQPFAFAATMPDIKELRIVYPQCADVSLSECLALLDETTYDGNFRFFLSVTDPQEELIIWDGDLDRGDFDGNHNDTDDFNTLPGVPGLPSWACTDPTKPCTDDGGANPRLGAVNFEGVAEGLFPSTGSPPDDFDSSIFGGLGAIFVRQGPLMYEVWGPDARLLATNDDPSGNREWEMFRLAVPDTPGYLDDNGLPPDADVAELPAGVYEIRVKNLDLENLNAFRFGVPAVTEPNCDDGRPTGLTFTYTADSCDETEASNNSQGGLPGTSGDYRCSGTLATGDGRAVKLVPVKKADRFEVEPASFYPGQDVMIRTLFSNDRLFPHTKLEVQDAATDEVLQEVTLHTSCSQPLIVGEQFGSLKLYTYFLKY
jgi:hypothetical protein